MLKKHYNNIKNSRLELFLIFIIPLIPTAFLLREGFYIIGDSFFPIDQATMRIFLSPSIYMWLDGNFGANYIWGFRAFLPSIVSGIFAFNLDLAQWIYWYIIFFLGSLGSFLLSGLFIKSTPFKAVAMLLYTINFWVISTPTPVLLQGIFLIPLLLYFYISYIEKKQVRFLCLHTLLFLFLATMQSFALYLIVLVLYNVVYLILSRSKYFESLKRNILILTMSALSVSFFLIPFLYSFLTGSPNTLTASVQAFRQSPAYMIYSADQNVLNSMRLISVERFFNSIYTGQTSNTVYGNILQFLSLTYIVLTLTYLLIHRKSNRKGYFLMTTYMFGIFLSSFQFIINIPAIREFVMSIYPPVSVDSASAVPLIMLPASIMIADVLEHFVNLINGKARKLALKILILLFIVSYVSSIVYPVYDSSNFSQVSYTTLNENALYIRSEVNQTDDSYILQYPISTMYTFPYTEYPITIYATFPYDKTISFIPLQTSYLLTREFLNQIIYPSSNTFSPNLFPQIGISQIVITKNVVGMDYTPYSGLGDKLIKSGFTLTYEDKNFLIYKAKDYTPLIHTANSVLIDGGLDEMLETIPQNRTVSNNGATPTDTSSTRPYYTGKLFPSGMRDFIYTVEIYYNNTDTVARNSTINLSPGIGMGAIWTATIDIPAGFSGWRSVTVNTLWQYDSLFIWIGNEVVALKIAYDTAQPCDLYASRDSGATWAADPNNRVFFRVTIYEQTNSSISTITSESLNLGRSAFFLSDQTDLTQWQFIQEHSVNGDYSPKISFQELNPTKYQISVTNATQPFLLVFSESYDQQWKAYVNEASGGTNWIEAFFQSSIPDDKHFLVNGYANAWYIDPSELKAGENFSITLYYKPQSLFYLGFILSFLTLAGCIGYMVWDWRLKESSITSRKEYRKLV